MNEPRGVQLGALLAEEAERAVPAQLDLWPNVSRRLHARRLPILPLEPDSSAPERPRGPSSRALPQPGGKKRSGELVGNALSFGLGALAIAIVTVVIGLTGRGDSSNGIGSGAPESAWLSRSSPERDATNPAAQTSTPESASNVDCTRDLDISPESERNRVVIPVELRTTGHCDEDRVLQLTIVDANGRRSPIAGSPHSVPLTSTDRGRQAVVEVEWRNWCGEPARFRIESRFGSERHTLPLPEPPPCVDQNRPSTMRQIPPDFASAVPATPVP